MFDTEGVVFADDLDVSYNPADYAAPALPAPIDEGRYGFRIDATTLSLAKNKEGELILRSGKPMLKIGKVEVVSGVERPRTVNLYQDFALASFPRFNQETGGTDTVNNLADLIASADDTQAWQGQEQGLSILQSLVQSGAIFHARFVWIAKDVETAKAEAQAVKDNSSDPTSPETKKLVNAVWKANTVKGQSKFNGKPYIAMASGDVEARVEIPMEGFVLQSQLGKLKLGPTFKRKVAA
jgi:hypothetical protein